MTWSECRSPLAVKTHGKLRRKSHLHFSCLPSSLAFVGGIDANFGTSTPFRSKPRPCVARFLSFEGRRNSRRNSRFSCNGKLRLSPLHSPLSTLQLASPLSPVEEVNNRYGRDLLLAIDLVRFCGNAYRHYNDESYRHLRTCYLEKFEIEKELAIVFPEIYLKLFGGLFEYARLFWIYHNRR
ncbi:hypothetical protein V6N13_083678 [Hibiscus sabdariffa]